MKSNTVLDFKQFKSKKELEVFTIALFHECTRLRLKVEDLQDKINHLEELLETALLSFKPDVE